MKRQLALARSEIKIDMAAVAVFPSANGDGLRRVGQAPREGPEGEAIAAKATVTTSSIMVDEESLVAAKDHVARNSKSERAFR